MRQLHLGPLGIGIYKWAQSDSNDKRANSIAVSEADLLSVYMKRITGGLCFLAFQTCSLSNGL